MQTKKVISILLIQIFSIFLLTACGGGGKSNTDPSLNNASFNVPENATNGTKVGKALVATDPDVKDILTYKITKGNTGAAFAIGKTSGQITVAKASVFNPLPASPFKLTVEVDDGAGGTGTATITIAVTDVNLAGSIPKTLTVNTSNGTVTPALGVADDGITYSITGGNAGGAFAITGANADTGQVTIATSTAIHPGDNIPLQIEATDGTLTDIITINVAIPNTSILPATLLGNLTIQPIDKGSIKNGFIADLGLGVDGFTFSIPGFNADSPFAISEDGVITINNIEKVVLGEGGNTIDILICNDFVCEIHTITITIADTPLLPAGHTLIDTTPNDGQNVTVNVGTPIGNVNDGLTYEITGGDHADSFNITIDPETGQVSINVNDDANLGSGTYTLEITITNGDGFTQVINVDIVIQTPPVLSFTKTKDLLRRAAAGTVVGTISVTLNDATAISNKALNKGGTTGASTVFELVDDKVVLSEGATLDNDSYTVDATYSSDAGVSKALPITINIIDDFENRTAKIIPFGNSLTAGEGYSIDDRNSTTRAVVLGATIPPKAAGDSYRHAITSIQTPNTATYDFIGFKKSDWASNVNHEGWSGYTSLSVIDGDGEKYVDKDSQYEDNSRSGNEILPLDDLVKSGKLKESDVVFITLGTNDALRESIATMKKGTKAGVIQTEVNIATIIDRMREENKNLVFLISNILPIDGSNSAIFDFGKYEIGDFYEELSLNTEDPLLDTEQKVIDNLKAKIEADPIFKAELKAKISEAQTEANELIPEKNTAIAKMVRLNNTESSPVLLVDMHAAFTDTTGTRKDLLSDGLHPNDKGETIMAQEWLDVLDQFFDGEAE